MIYQITNTITNDFYIGYTSLTLEARFAKHKQNARAGGPTHLYNAMRKYGEENFQISCLQESGSLNEDEPLWIAQLKPSYNMTAGGEGGRTADSPNFIEAIKNRRSYKGSGNPQFGKHGADNPKSQRILLDGVEYVSITEARKLAKKSFQYVKKHGIVI
jgi:group I intron endonuclease